MAQLSDAALAKVKKATLMVLNKPTDRSGEPTNNTVTDTRFWAMITGNDITGKRFTYVRIYPTAQYDIDDFKLQNGIAYKFADSEAGVGFAREANGNPGVPDLTVVEMSFMGYDGTGEPAYIFSCSIGVPDDKPIMPHDHRDNFNGGFAFSVFHPGTALPQQPWGI